MMILMTFIEPTVGMGFTSCIHQKIEESIRLCFKYRKLGAAMVNNTYLMANIDD